jgi:protein arginine kinase activator
MQCDVCHSKEATRFLTQILEGKIQKVNLCQACSKERGVEDPTGFALTELLVGLGTSIETEKPVHHAEPSRAEPSHKCPVCGFSQADFKKTGRLGCSACYATFGESLSALLKAMHKGTSHTGKVPERIWRRHQLTERLKSLEEDLQKAVREENYESAAHLRDQIRQESENTHDG